MLVGELGERLNFLRTVDRPHLGGLCNRNHPRLRVMFVADPVIGMADGLRNNLALLLRQRNQLAARVLFRRAAFVRTDVSVVAAEYGLEGAGQSLQPQYIRASPVESEKNCNVRSEMLFKLLDRRTGIRIVS